MKKTLNYSMLILFLMLFSIDLSAQWERLGSRKVDFRQDNDVIMVTAYEGRFSKLKLKINKAPIYLKNIRIVYGNGNSTELKVNRMLENGTETRAFDLPGDKRVIQKIVFNYRSVPSFRGKGIITVFGRR